jgi:lyso-ornithine lipid O-acyltransferase
MGCIRATLIVVAFLALTLPLMAVQFICNSRRLPWYYHRILSKILGMAVSVEGVLPKNPALLVSNHLSWLDIPLFGSVLPLSFIAKSEVRHWPLFGGMARLQRTVFVDRERRHLTGVKRNEIALRLQAGDTLVLFPEGTSSDGSNVLPFKSSYFGAVEGLDIPVVPVTIIYLGTPKIYGWYGDMELLPHLWAVLKSGPIAVRVIFHAPVQKSDRKTMARAAEATVRAALHADSEIR